MIRAEKAFPREKRAGSPHMPPTKKEADDSSSAIYIIGTRPKQLRPKGAIFRGVPFPIFKSNASLTFFQGVYIVSPKNCLRFRNYKCFLTIDPFQFTIVSTVVEQNDHVRNRDRMLSFILPQPQFFNKLYHFVIT